MKIKKFIREEEAEIKSLEKLVEDSLNDERILTRKIKKVEEDRRVTFGQKLSDIISSFGGSWKFIIVFGLFLLSWIWINAHTDLKFDVYPYIFLNLVLACVTSLQAPLIMMSQNRQEEKDRRRSRSDYILSLKAEIEIQKLHKKFDLILEKLCENKNE